MLTKQYESKSGQFGYQYDNESRILFSQFRDFTKSDTAEFLQFVAALGDEMKKQNTGKMLMDISEMRGFDIAKRVAVVKNLPAIYLSKIPYLALGVVKGRSLFENATMQLAIAACKPLSKKFEASEMFDSHDKVVAWLKQYHSVNHDASASVLINR